MHKQISQVAQLPEFARKTSNLTQKHHFLLVFIKNYTPALKPLDFFWYKCVADTLGLLSDK